MEGQRKGGSGWSSTATQDSIGLLLLNPEGRDLPVEKELGKRPILMRQDRAVNATGSTVWAGSRQWAGHRIAFVQWLMLP